MDHISYIEPSSEVFDNLPTAIYTTDAEGCLTYFNRAAVKFSGREPQLGSDEWCVTWKLFYPDGTPMRHDECPMAIALREGRSIEGAEAIAERPDGERIWFNAYPSPFFDNEGNVIGGINLLIDITDRKKAEKELSRSEKELKDFFENAVMGLHWVGPDGIILRANQKELEMLGYKREEYIGHHISEFHADQEIINDILKRLKKGEELNNYKAKLQCKDGSVRHVRLSSNVYRENGKFIHTRCFTRDMTEYEKAVQELHEQKRYLDTVFNTTPDCIKILDSEGVIRQMNPAGQAIMGAASDSEIIGKKYTDLIAPSHRKTFAEFNKRICRGESGSIEFEAIGLHGKPFHMETHAAPLRNPDGTFSHLAITRDITSRKQAGEKLRESEEKYRTLFESMDEGLCIG